MAVATEKRRDNGTSSRPMSFGQVDWSKQSDILDFVTSSYKRRDQYRGQREKQWYTNVFQFLGYQYHSLDMRSGKLTVPPSPSYRVRLVCNKLQGIARKFVSKGMRSRPVWTVIPATADIEDINVARIAQKLLQYYWRSLGMDQTMVEFLTWLATTGNAFMRCYWDPDKGEEVDLAEEVAQYMPDAKVKNTVVHLGDPCVEAVSPFEVDVDPECLRLEDARYLIHSKVRDISYLEAKYGVKGLTPDASETTSMTRYYERRLQTLAGSGVGFESNDDDNLDSCVTHTIWVNPTKDLPKGWYAIIASNKILHQDVLPNPFHRIPYIHCKEISVPGQFWGTSALEGCIPMQAEYNRGRSQLCENRNLMSKPKWLVPKGSGVADTQLTSEPGEVIYHVLGMAPQAWTPPPVPDYVMKLLEYSLKDIEDLAANHEVTQARAPSGVRSGVAIAQLQEQDDQMSAPAFLLTEKGLSCIASWLLQLCAEYIKEERIVKIAGKDKRIEAMTFTGKQLVGGNQGRPGVNYYDVETQMASQLPLSKSAKMQYAIDLVNARILDPIQDKKKIFQILELGSEEPSFSDEQLDRQLANQENVLMTQGVMVEVNPWDNDLVHMEELRRFQKQPEFQDLVKTNPQIVQIFEQHFNGHALRYQAMTSPAPQAAPPEQQGPPSEEPPEAQAPAPGEGFSEQEFS